VKIRDIIVGEDYCVTVPGKRELASDAERQLADHSLTASVVLETAGCCTTSHAASTRPGGSGRGWWPRACRIARPTLA
jgi:hypothetical protein